MIQWVHVPERETLEFASEFIGRIDKSRRARDLIKRHTRLYRVWDSSKREVLRASITMFPWVTGLCDRSDNHNLRVSTLITKISDIFLIA